MVPKGLHKGAYAGTIPSVVGLLLAFFGVLAWGFTGLWVSCSRVLEG